MKSHSYKTFSLKWSIKMYELIESMTTPIMWVLGLILLGLILRLRPQRKRLCFFGQFMIIAAGLILYVFSIPAISERLLYSLESQTTRPDIEALSSLELVVVLGGGYYPSGGFRESGEPSDLTYARVFGGVKTFKNSGAGALVLCEGRQENARESGAEVMKALTVKLGVDEDKIITEDKSQNTMENAKELKKLLTPKKQRKIGLVTSALHMPRSERVFRQVFPEDTIVPIPVGYRYKPRECYLETLIPTARALQTSTEAVHEWIGMLWYTIRYH
jgi:uncharacterized SAM-binding protein YcdF (DUF218 family)